MNSEPFPTRQITIHATGRILQAPDQVCLDFTIRESRKDYGECLSLLTSRVKKLESSLEAVQLTKQNLYTGQLQIHPQYDYHDGRQQFRGYEAWQQMEIRFPFQNDHLGKILQAVSQSESSAEFAIRFELADEAPARDAALDRAIKQASGRAQQMAYAAGVAVGAILSMTHHTREQSAPSPMDVRLSASKEAMTFSVNPAAMVIEEQVTMIWELKDK